MCYYPLRFILSVTNCATQKEINIHDLRDRKNLNYAEPFFTIEPSGVPFAFLSFFFVFAFASLPLCLFASLPRCLVASWPRGLVA